VIEVINTYQHSVLGNGFKSRINSTRYTLTLNTLNYKLSPNLKLLKSRITLFLAVVFPLDHKHWLYFSVSTASFEKIGRTTMIRIWHYKIFKILTSDLLPSYLH